MRRFGSTQLLGRRRAAATAMTLSFAAGPATAAVPYDTVALTGDAAPGTGAGVVYGGFNDLVLNGAGQTAFRGFLTGSGVGATNNEGVWSEGGGTLGLVARHGDAAPGTGEGAVYSSFGDLVLNGAGQTAFGGFVTGPGLDFTNNQGIWSEGGGTLSLVARGGDAAPGTGAGVVYGFLNNPVFNGAGQTAFRSFLTGPGVGATNNEGVWSEGGGALGMVAREGDPAPGTEFAVVYSNFLFDPVLNDAGQTAFRGDLTGRGVNDTNDWGNWSEGGGTLGLVARGGDAAPGTGAGVVFSGVSSPALQRRGSDGLQWRSHRHRGRRQ